jgi:hypothetical protein
MDAIKKEKYIGLEAFPKIRTISTHSYHIQVKYIIFIISNKLDVVILELFIGN